MDNEWHLACVLRRVHFVGSLTARNFGLLIAYVIPGFVALAGLGIVSEPVRLWLLGADDRGPTVGGVVYLLLACVAAGMTASAVRWLLIDQIHARAGLVPPLWNDAWLEERREAYELLIELHYRYYQFYGNTLVTLLFSYATFRMSSRAALGWVELGVIFLSGVFFAASRDALSKYHRRSQRLLSGEKGQGVPMTNGGHHETSSASAKEQKGSDNKKPAGAPPQQKSAQKDQDTGKK